MRGCNSPSYYTTIATCEGDIPDEAFVVSETYGDEHYQVIRGAMNMAAQFLGVTSNLRVFLSKSGLILSWDGFLSNCLTQI